jgi:hypothetical protein
LPDLDLTGFQWLVVGGESGPRHRTMDHAWARQLRDMAKAQGVAFFFKQSSGARAGQGDLLDGREWKEYPAVPPDFQTTTNDDGEQARREEELRQAEEKAARELEHERQREEERLAAEREAAHLREENEQLQAAVQRQQQEVESLRADLARQCQETERVHANWESRWKKERAGRFRAEVDAELWQLSAEDARRQARTARDLYLELLRLTGSGWFTGQSGVGAIPLAVQQDLAVLGLTWPTTEDAVKTAYRELAKQHHPDRGGNSKDFMKVQAAHDRVMKALRESSVR